MTDELPSEVGRALLNVIESDEQVIDSVSSLGGTLVLTDRRLFIIRYGWSYRPRSGVRWWRLGGSSRIRSGPLKLGLGRVVVSDEIQSGSIFVREADWADAQRLISAAHRVAGAPK